MEAEERRKTDMVEKMKRGGKHGGVREKKDMVEKMKKGGKHGGGREKKNMGETEQDRRKT